MKCKTNESKWILLRSSLRLLFLTNFLILVHVLKSDFMEIGVTGANFEEFDGENSGYTILRKKMQ